MRVLKSLVLTALWAVSGEAFLLPHGSFSTVGLRMSSEEEEAAQPSSLLPDQGVRTTMNPGYQIDKHSIYPTNRRNPPSGLSQQPNRIGRAGFSASPDYQMWDGTTGMSRDPISPDSYMPAGMASFSQRQAKPAPPTPPEPSTAEPVAEATETSLAVSETPEEDEDSKISKQEYAQALRSRAGRNHRMWSGTEGMDRAPIDPYSTYPTGMRRGMW